MKLRSPMKHPSLRHLSKRDRWLHLQRFNGTWIGNVGLLLFVVAAIVAFVCGGMLLVWTDLTRYFRGNQQGPVLAALAAMCAIGFGALAWEAFRRVMINRALDRPIRCGCGYERSGLAAGAKCPECGRQDS